MRINDKDKIRENVSSSQEIESFGEFSKSEIATLFPATEILHKIHSDHLYTGSDFTNSEHDTTDESDIEDSSHNEDDILSLNADSIQQVFQRMVNMTALDTIYDISKQGDGEGRSETIETGLPNRRRVTFADELPTYSREFRTSTPMLAPRENNESRKTGKGSNNGVRTRKYQRRRNTKFVKKEKEENAIKCNEVTPATCKSVSGEEWRIANRCSEAEREINALIQHTAELLVRRWGEYLSMTAEQIRSFEIMNAKEHKMIEEVVEMLEDKDRYVWQLIEDLQFF